jgi:copper transport protein
MLLLAHVGVLVGQGLALASGKSATPLTPAMLENLALSGHFGLWWLLRVFLLLLMFTLLFSERQVRRRTSSFGQYLSWVSLFFGLLLLIALALSSHAAAVTPEKVTGAVLVDWLHLFAAALWVGGMLTIVLSYVPVLSRHSLAERATSLVTALPYYSPWALGGVLLMAITGPLSATFQLTSWQQLLTTAYGTVLLVKILLVTAMLLLSAYQILVLRPRIRVAWQKHVYATDRLQMAQALAETDQVSTRLAGQAKQREARLAQPTRQLLTVLRLEPVLGVAVLLCVGLMNVLGGTLVPSTTTTSASSTPHAIVQPTRASALSMVTFNHRFQVIFTMTPQHVGTNHVRVRIVDPQTGKAVSTVKVQLNTELQDRNMGVTVVPLKVDGAGQFSGIADLPVSGTWLIIVQIQTPDDPYHFHEASTDVDLAS